MTASEISSRADRTRRTTIAGERLSFMRDQPRSRSPRTIRVRAWTRRESGWAPSCGDPSPGDTGAWEASRARFSSEGVSGDGDVVFEIEPEGPGDLLPPGGVLTVWGVLGDKIGQGDGFARAVRCPRDHTV